MIAMASQGHAVFCCDANALINFARAERFTELDALARQGLLRIPMGVYAEVFPHQREGREKRLLARWKEDARVAVSLDDDAVAKSLLPDIERTYGPQFHIGGLTYAGFWSSKAGRDAADGEVVAFAKAYGWTVVSNDGSVRGACLLEGIECHSWEQLAHRLDTVESQPSSAQQLPFDLA